MNARTGRTAWFQEQSARRQPLPSPDRIYSGIGGQMDFIRGPRS
jgi:hypothetical protein